MHEYAQYIQLIQRKMILQSIMTIFTRFKILKIIFSNYCRALEWTSKNSSEHNHLIIYLYHLKHGYVFPWSGGVIIFHC